MRSSQHDLMWRQLLPKVRRHDEPLQVQLCTAFVTAMLDGRLPGGTRLPSSRDLAMLTGVSRNTAVLVYERLVAEGYVDSRPRDGFCMRRHHSDTDHPASARTGCATT